MAEDSQYDKERERKILEGFLSGTEMGVRTFLKEYSGFILKAISMVRLKDNSLTIDDLYCDCVELLLRNDKRVVRLFKRKCRFSSYLFAVCRRYAIKIATRPQPLPPSMNTYEPPAALAEEFSEEERTLLKRAIRLCSSNEQIFVKMMFYDERSTKEIMESFGWKSENTVYSQKNKITSKLKKNNKRLHNGKNE